MCFQHSGLNDIYLTSCANIHFLFVQACEQLNAWIGGYQSVLNRMSPNNFNWFLHSLLFLHTEQVIKAQREKEKAQQDRGRNEDDNDDDDDIDIDID
jgi:hypothetical protein